MIYDSRYGIGYAGVGWSGVEYGTERVNEESVVLYGYMGMVVGN
jgi:hypothetical protein